MTKERLKWTSVTLFGWVTGLCLLSFLVGTLTFVLDLLSGNGWNQSQPYNLPGLGVLFLIQLAIYAPAEFFSRGLGLVLLIVLGTHLLIGDLQVKGKTAGKVFFYMLLAWPAMAVWFVLHGLARTANVAFVRSMLETVQ